MADQEVCITKGIRRGSHRTVNRPAPHGRGFGIDFWHAVEFSRSGRTPFRGLSTRLRGNSSNLVGPLHLVKPKRFRIPSPARLNATASDESRRPAGRRSWEAAPGPATSSVSVPPCRATSKRLRTALDGVKSRHNRRVDSLPTLAEGPATRVRQWVKPQASSVYSGCRLGGRPRVRSSGRGGRGAAGDGRGAARGRDVPRRLTAARITNPTREPPRPRRCACRGAAGASGRATDRP